MENQDVKSTFNDEQLLYYKQHRNGAAFLGVLAGVMLMGIYFTFSK